MNRDQIKEERARLDSEIKKLRARIKKLQAQRKSEALKLPRGRTEGARSQTVQAQDSRRASLNMLKALRDYRRGHSKRVPGSEKEKMWHAARAKYPHAKKSITYRLIDLRYRVLMP